MRGRFIRWDLCVKRIANSEGGNVERRFASKGRAMESIVFFCEAHPQNSSQSASSRFSNTCFRLRYLRHEASGPYRWWIGSWGHSGTSWPWLSRTWPENAHPITWPPGFILLLLLPFLFSIYVLFLPLVAFKLSFFILSLSIILTLFRGI